MSAKQIYKMFGSNPNAVKDIMEGYNFKTNGIANSAGCFSKGPLSWAPYAGFLGWSLFSICILICILIYYG